jgi:hypothetical protein
MSTAYDDLRKYFIMDQTDGRECVVTCDALEDAREMLRRRVCAGSSPSCLSVIHGEKLAFQYQQTLLIKFEGEGTDP